MKNLILLALTAAAVTALCGAPSAGAAPCDPERFDCGEPIDTSAPRAGLFVVERSPAGVRVKGYAIDGDTNGPIGARVLIDDVEVATITANKLDSGPLHLGYHGFDDVVPAREGSQVCVDPIDYDPAGGPGLQGEGSCLSFLVRVDPFGALESVERDDPFVRVRGWAFDPDRAEGIRVQVFHDGGLVATTPTIVPRPGVVPPGHTGYGVAHGFDVAVPKGPGRHLICVFVKNEGAGLPSSFLGCRTYGPPIAPTVTAEPDTWMGHREIRIRWTDNADDESGYAVERLQPDGSWAAVAPSTGPMAGAGRSVAVTSGSLAPDTSYCFRVRTWNAFGDAGAQACTKTTVAPPPTSLVSFSVSPGQVQICDTVDVTISWSAISARRFVVRRNGVFIGGESLPAPQAGPWQKSITDRHRAESAVTYRLELYGYDGKLALAANRTVTVTGSSTRTGSVRTMLHLIDEADVLAYRGRVQPPTAPADARVTSVRNVTDGRDDPQTLKEIPTPTIDVSHDRQTATLAHDAPPTSAFNGLLVVGDWFARAHSAIGLNGLKGDDQKSWFDKPDFTLEIAWTASGCP